MNKKIFLALILSVAMMLPACGDKEDKDPPADMPENILAHEDGSELIPVDEVEVVGTELEASEEDMRLPTEEELGEYQEIFLEGDIIDEDTLGGWVVSVSLKDITVNTYNELTTYALDDSAMQAAYHLKPGDAVLLSYYENEDGSRVAYDIGRVRMEDEPLTREEILETYGELEAGNADE